LDRTGRAAFGHRSQLAQKDQEAGNGGSGHRLIRAVHSRTASLAAIPSGREGWTAYIFRNNLLFGGFN
jgi:hypothetical protein